MKNKKIAKIVCLFICMLICVGCEKTEQSDEYKPTILESGVSLGEESALSYIPNEIIEENSMQEIARFQDDLLSTYCEYDTSKEKDVLHLKVISLETGELKHETELEIEEYYAITVQVYENKIVVNDAKAEKIHVLDDELKEINSYEVSGNFIYVDSTVTTAYCIVKNKEIQKINLENEKKESIFENVAYLTVCSNLENFLSFKYVDLSKNDKKESYAGLNLETGEIEKLNIDDSFSSIEYYDGIWAGGILSDNQKFLIGTQEKPYKFETKFQYSSIKICSEQMRFMLNEIDEEGKQRKTLYDKDGKYISSYSSEEMNGILSDEQIWLEGANGYLFLTIDENGNNRLYFWNLEQKTEGNNLEFMDYNQKEEIKGGVLEQKYYEEADSLLKDYGIKVKIAEQCATDYDDKFAEQEYDVEKIRTAFAHLKNAVSSYPEGFFQQLKFGTYRTIEINLIGKIKNSNEAEVYESNAFVQLRDGKIIMVINITENIEGMEKIFYHESSHIIDAALDYDSTYREDAVYSEEKWNQRNPESFVNLNPEMGGYYGSYEMMPMEYYEEEFVPYFVDDYGKTFATEDRATIFENAMIGNKQQFSTEIFQPLHDKLEYYCESIRDYFDTTGWPECTVWEEVL